MPILQHNKFDRMFDRGILNGQGRGASSSGGHGSRGSAGGNRGGRGDTGGKDGRRPKPFEQAQSDARRERMAKLAAEKAAFDALPRSEQLDQLIRDNPNASADKKSAWITEAEGLRYEEIYRPLNQQLMGELKTNKLTDAARLETNKVVNNGFADPKQLARVQRQAGRQGLSVTSGQAQSIQRADKFGNALGVAKTMDHARVAEQDRKDGLRGELINLGRGIATSATNGLTEAAANETQRNNTNNQIRAQDKAAKRQGIGSMAGAGIGFAVGGPAGAMVGGAIGGAVGGIFD